MARRELCSFRWDGTRWASVTLSSEFQSQNQSWTTCCSNSRSQVDGVIRVATFNVLADCFPWFIEMAIRSTERFEWLVKGIINLNPTILGLNEVTTTALEQLQQCPFIRENYFITESLDKNQNDSISAQKICTNSLLSPHGCVILSKIPLIELFAVTVSGSMREAVVGKVQLNNNIESCVYVCSHHTTAYQTPKNAQLRAKQIRDLVEVLEPLSLPFIIMGDLNLHYEFEDAVVIDNQLIDAWAQTHFSHVYPFNDENSGYTFDAINNKLIPYYIPGERRQMRLDRILFSRRFPAFAVAPCSLWANESIKSDNYLFPSDHFGLSIDLIINIGDNNNEIMSVGEPDPSAEKILFTHAQNNQNQQAYRPGFIKITTALMSHIVWLGATTLGFK